MFGKVDADAFAARIAEGRRPVVNGGGRRDHMDEFRLVGGGHDHEIG